MATSALPITIAALGLAFTVFAAKIIHALYFHPLAKYPGPFLGKITNLYAAYHGWRGDIHLDIWRCHQKYGDCIRYKPNSLLINTPEGLRDIYGYGSAAKFIKSNDYAPMIHRAPNTLTIRGGRDHARRRRIMAQGVSDKAQRGYETRIMRHVDKFCGIVFDHEAAGKRQTEGEGGGRWSKPMDMSKWCNYLSFDIMADVIFGAQYNLLEQDRFRYVTECIDRSNQRMSALIQAPSLTFAKLDKYIFRDAIKGRNRFVKFVVRVVKERLDASSSGAKKAEPVLSDDPLAGGVEGYDVFGNLETARDPETGDAFRPDEIAAESATLIVAGSETSSTAIATTMFYLAHNADAYARAAAEVRSTFNSGDKIHMGPQLSSCVYLRACIDEALRITPPVGSSLWREVVAPGGAVIDGKAVPAGVDVGVGIYSIHHNTRCFADPFVYRPERWLEDDGTGDSVKRARDAFNPFSIGNRSCLGKGLAQTEILLTMAAVLSAGDFRLTEGELGRVGCGRKGAEFGRHRTSEYQMWDHVTGQKVGPILQFRARDI